MSTSTRIVRRTLPLLSLAALIHVGGVAAADSQGDFQQGVRNVLAGNGAAHSTQLAEPVATRTPPSTDSQEFAKRLLLGVTASPNPTADPTRLGSSTAASITSGGKSRVLDHTDTQAAVRRLLLGQQNTIS